MWPTPATSSRYGRVRLYCHPWKATICLHVDRCGRDGLDSKSRRWMHSSALSRAQSSRRDGGMRRHCRGRCGRRCGRRCRQRREGRRARWGVAQVRARWGQVDQQVTDQRDDERRRHERAHASNPRCCTSTRPLLAPQSPCEPRLARLRARCGRLLIAGEARCAPRARCRGCCAVVTLARGPVLGC